MKKTILIVIFILFTSTNAYALSGRWGLIVNQKLNKCSRFWEGNECEIVSVPTGWSTLFPEWSKTKQINVINLGSKSCSWSGSKPAQCCQELGLEFDSTFKAPSKKTGLEKNPNSICYQLPTTSTK